MAAGGSNVRLSLVGLTGTTAEIMYTIDTTGRYEDGYLIVFNENNTEVSRTSSFRAYGNSSGSQNVTGIESGHLYTVKFYSSDLGVYSESTVEIDLRSGTPAYAISSSSTATSVNIIVSPISSATMGKDGTVIVESASDGIKESIGYKSSDSSTSITLVGLDQNTEYTFSVTYYDPGLASSVTNTITISTSELGAKQGPKLYGGVSGDAEGITKLYGGMGKNLFNVNSITENTGAATTGEEDHVVTYSSSDYRAVMLVKVNPSSTYTLSINDTSIVDKIFIVGMKDTEVESGNSFGWKTSGSVLNTSSKDNYLLGVINCASGQGTIANITSARVQIEPGSSATPYEAFVGSKLITKLYGGSDDYVFNNLQLKGNTTQQTYSGKNFLNLVDGGHYGVSGTVNSDGTVTISGKATATTGESVFGSNQTIPAGTYTMTISKTLPFLINLSLASGVSFRIPAGQTSVTTTLSTSYTNGGIFMAMTSDVTYNETFNIQIVSGSTPDYDFEPYVGGIASPNPNYPQTVNVVTGEQTITVSDGNNNSDTYTVDLGSTELCKIGTYQDKIYKNGGNWYVHKETGKVVFDGSESWTRSTYSSTNNFYTPVADALKDASFINIRSDMFSPTPLSWGSLSNEVYGIALYNITSQIRILYPQSLISDANAFKTWLSTHNTTVYYALETPTDTQITNANLIAELEAIRKGAYGDDTQIVVNGNLPAIVAYDSIDETAKLIHISRPNKKVYGSITYYTDSNHTMTDIEFIYDQTDVNKLVGNGQLTWSATINGKTINNLDIKEVDISGCTSLTTTPVNFLQHCRNLDSISIPSSLISIGSGFLSYCASFNQQIILHTGISSIGDAFLFCCEAFNQPIVFPNTLTSIGITFLGGCIAFNQDLTIPSSVITIGQNFMAVCDSMIKTITCNAPSPRVGSSENINLSGSSVNAQCYVSGIKLSGPYASSWHSENPDSSSGPYYRKTIVV